MNDIKFTTLKAKLYLKLERKDPTYTEEMEELCDYINSSQMHKYELRSLLISLSRNPEGWNESMVLDVAEKTGCISKDLLILNSNMIQLGGKKAEVQVETIQKILKSGFPSDTTNDDIFAFYSEFTSIAISAKNNTLLEELIVKMEAINE